jgi:hypothetical protein
MSRMGGTSTHTSFIRGAPVRVILRNGYVLIGKFVEKHSEKEIRVRVDGVLHKIKTADLSSANYYKPLPHELRRKA